MQRKTWLVVLGGFVVAGLVVAYVVYSRHAELERWKATKKAEAIRIDDGKRY